MTKNVEKDMHSVKDSVRAGIIIDDLSRLVDDVKNITATHNKFDELSDEELFKVAGGIRADINDINNELNKEN